MTLRPLILALALVAGFAAPASAESFATVNIQQIMRDSTAAKSVKEQLDAKQKAFQSEMSRKEEELQKEEQELSKQRAVLSPDAFDKKLKEFRSKATAAQKDVQNKRAELDSAFSSALGEIQKAVLDIVSTIAHEKGFTVVMPTSQLLYADPKLDITSEVLTRLNSTLPKVHVSFKTAGREEQ